MSCFCLKRKNIYYVNEGVISPVSGRYSVSNRDDLGRKGESATTVTSQSMKVTNAPANGSATNGTGCVKYASTAEDTGTSDVAVTEVADQSDHNGNVTDGTKDEIPPSGNPNEAESAELPADLVAHKEEKHTTSTSSDGLVEERVVVQDTIVSGSPTDAELKAALPYQAENEVLSESTVIASMATPEVAVHSGAQHTEAIVETPATALLPPRIEITCASETEETTQDDSLQMTSVKEERSGSISSHDSSVASDSNAGSGEEDQRQLVEENECNEQREGRGATGEGERATSAVDGEDNDGDSREGSGHIVVTTDDIANFTGEVVTNGHPENGQDSRRSSSSYHSDSDGETTIRKTMVVTSQDDAEDRTVTTTTTQETVESGGVSRNVSTVTTVTKSFSTPDSAFVEHEEIELDISGQNIYVST